MYKMKLKILGYKLRLEVVVICVLLGVIIGSSMACSCRREGAIGRMAAEYGTTKGMSDGVHSQKWGDAANHYETKQLNSGAGDSMFFYANNKFSPESCAYSTVSGSSGCADVTSEQSKFIEMRGGNRTVDDGFN